MKMHLLKWLITGLALSLFASLSTAQQATLEDYGQLVDGVRDVSAKDASQILDSFPEVRVLDVRTGFEYNRGHIANAVNVNYYSFSFRKKLAALDKDSIWLLHCKVGVRSGKTIPIMKELGFKNIIHLTHGIDEWREAGLPEVKE